MDTQGTLDDAGLSYQMSSTIFALSTLFSSMQVYNIVESIAEESLANLSLFAEYGRLVQDEGNKLKPPFQVSKLFQFINEMQFTFNYHNLNITFQKIIFKLQILTNSFKI